MTYIRKNYGNEKQMRNRFDRVYHEKLNALMAQRREIISEASIRGINPTFLFQNALASLEIKHRAQ